jgi:hypothetical protein
VRVLMGLGARCRCREARRRVGPAGGRMPARRPRRLAKPAALTQYRNCSGHLLQRDRTKTSCLQIADHQSCGSPVCSVGGPGSACSARHWTVCAAGTAVAGAEAPQPQPAVSSVPNHERAFRQGALST